LTQVAFLVSIILHSRQVPFDPSTQVRSSALSSSLSASNSVIPMRRATIHHHPSISSFTPSHFSQRPQRIASPPLSPNLPKDMTMPVLATFTSPTLKTQSSLPNFPLPPVRLQTPPSSESVSSLRISQINTMYPSQSTDTLATFPFRNSMLDPRNSVMDPHSSIIEPLSSPSKKQKRNSGILKSLTLRPETQLPRKKTSLSSLPTPSFPSLSPRKRFKSMDGSVHTSSQSTSDITVWDDWNAGDEDPRVRERVEMSFESVRLEQYEPKQVDGLGIAAASFGSTPLSPLVGTPVVGGGRNVSAGSGFSSGSPTPGEMGWKSPASVLKGGFKWS
jgi:hypothetical protein